MRLIMTAAEVRTNNSGRPVLVRTLDAVVDELLALHVVAYTTRHVLLCARARQRPDLHRVQPGTRGP